MVEQQYVLALDVGTTFVRCHVVNSNAETVGSSFEKIELVYPEPGFVEIEPNQLWETVKTVMKNAIRGAHLSPSQITAIGIATQRGTFLLWDKTTGRSFTNFITWRDLRASTLVKNLNKSFLINALKIGTGLLYTLTRQKRFLAISKVQFTQAHLVIRLDWILKNMPEVKEAVKNDNAMLGTLDTWLIYKLTNGKTFVTDVSNVCATGLYDPFVNDYNSLGLKFFNIPKKLLPEVVDNATEVFGEMDPSILGAAIPIRCSLADQSASMLGSLCHKNGDFKVTLGTGSFLDITTGKTPLASFNGLYPLIGWKYGGEIAYVLEGGANDAGSLVEWALQVGLIVEPSKSAAMAESIEDTDGVFFIPAFTGIGIPVNDAEAAAGFIGVKPTTTKECLVRAILESVVFRVYQIYRLVITEVPYKFRAIKIDGGVSNNDFVCQMLADITNLEVERCSNVEMATNGVVYLTGLQCGIWKSKDELQKFKKISNVFQPKANKGEAHVLKFNEWSRAVDRFMNWYQR